MQQRSERSIKGQFSEEAMLVRRAQAGDRVAFDRLAKQYRGMVLAVA